MGHAHVCFGHFSTRPEKIKKCRGDYRTVDGMKVPFYLEAVWNLESDDLSYAKFKIDRIEYNNPSKF